MKSKSTTKKKSPTIVELKWFGWHPEINLWVARDCAVTPDGGMLGPDEAGVIWWQGIGYRVSDSDTSGEKLMVGSFVWKIRPGIPTIQPAEAKSRVEILEDYVRDATDANEAKVAIGWVASIAAGPEIMRDHFCFPGLWISGQRGIGKSTLMKILCWVWGGHYNYISYHSGSMVGLKLAFNQVCHLPVPIEDFSRGDIRKEEFLKQTYTRESPPRRLNQKENARKIRGPAIVCSELHRDPMPATRQRFLWLEVKRKPDNRLVDRGRVLLAVEKIGLYILQNRKRFVEEFLTASTSGRVDSREELGLSIANAGYKSLKAIL